MNPSWPLRRWCTLGVMLERLGQDASEAYARAYANDPPTWRPAWDMAARLIANGRPAEAIELLQPLATYPSSPEEAREPYALALAGRGARGGGRALCLGTVRAQPQRQSRDPSLRHRRSGGP